MEEWSHVLSRKKSSFFYPYKTERERCTFGRSLCEIFPFWPANIGLRFQLEVSVCSGHVLTCCCCCCCVLKHSDRQTRQREVLSFRHRATLQPSFNSLPPSLLPYFLFSASLFFPSRCPTKTHAFLPIACGLYCPEVATPPPPVLPLGSLSTFSILRPPSSLCHFQAESHYHCTRSRTCVCVCVCGRMNQDVCWKKRPMDSPGTIHSHMLKRRTSQSLITSLQLVLAYYLPRAQHMERIRVSAVK